MSDRQYLKDVTYLKIAKEVANLATCCRLKVGCVLLTEDGRVAGMGYNGTGPGMPHCDPSTCGPNCRCSRTVHAEVNALANCAGKPYTAYLTHENCVSCCKSLILHGVRRIVFEKPYTSIAPEEAKARQEWLDFYKVAWVCIPLED